jgi:hypothetical protein
VNLTRTRGGYVGMSGHLRAVAQVRGTVLTLA